MKNTASFAKFDRLAAAWTLARPVGWLLAASLLLAAQAGAATVTGQVVGVVDGDTIKLLDADQRQHTIRLSGIDAPEKKQAFGQRSKASLSQLVFGQYVQVETGKSDRYGRSLGKVLLAGEDVNLEQLRRGLAWHYKKYANQQPAPERAAYLLAENLARQAEEGLWQDPHPVAPWTFRHPEKAAAGEQSTP